MMEFQIPSLESDTQTEQSHESWNQTGDALQQRMGSFVARLAERVAQFEDEEDFDTF